MWAVPTQEALVLKLLRVVPAERPEWRLSDRCIEGMKRAIRLKFSPACAPAVEMRRRAHCFLGARR